MYYVVYKDKLREYIYTRREIEEGKKENYFKVVQGNYKG